MTAKETRTDFWSRRKAAAQAEAQAEIDATQNAEAALTEAELAAKSDEELLAEVGLPEPEAAQTPEEVRAYLKASLPRRLKDRALRRLWRLNPVLANLDGLVDYGEDYTDAATVVENLQTVYQVGRGMLTKLEEIDEPEDETVVEPDSTDADNHPGPEAENPVNISNSTKNLEPETVQEIDNPNLFDDKLTESAMVTPVYRRMRFRFEGSNGGNS